MDPISTTAELEEALQGRTVRRLFVAADGTVCIECEDGSTLTRGVLIHQENVELQLHGGKVSDGVE